MPHIYLNVNGLTHHEVASQRMSFVSTAVGRQVMFVAQPCAADACCVAAYVGARRVGNVAAGDAVLAHRVLLTAADELLTGSIVAVDDKGFQLRVDLGERALAAEKAVHAMLPLGLYGWTSPVPPLAVTEPRLQHVGAMVKLLYFHLRAGNVDDACEVTRALTEVLRFDLSVEMQRHRKMLCQTMADSGDARLQRAAELLAEASQRMGGDHQMEEVGRWLQTELAFSREADALLALTPRGVTRRQVEERAEALPGTLYRLWLTDATQFARVIYGMRLNSTELRHVLACLIWLKRTLPDKDTGAPRYTYSCPPPSPDSHDAEAPVDEAAGVRGRPLSVDRDFMNGDNDLVQQRHAALSEVLAGVGGKEAALAVSVADDAHWFTQRPTWGQLRKTFGCAGASSGYYAQLNKRFDDAEITRMKLRLGIT